MISTNSKIIRATQEKVFNAFIDKNALEQWLAPNDMAGKIHDFDARAGGGYSMSLFYLDAAAKGKTTGNEDRFYVKFVELQPFEKIIQTVNFRSDNEQFRGEMIMETYLQKIEESTTRVSMIFKNIPPGIDPKDNEEGTRQSLEKLASYVEGA